MMRRPGTWVSGEARGRPRTGHRDVPEPWEADTEPFEGATVLDDLESTVGDAQSAAIILARYAVLRFLLRAWARSNAHSWSDERAAAILYLEGARAMQAGERSALRRVLTAARPWPEQDLAASLIEAAPHAATAGHTMGAFALLRAAYCISVERAWPAVASRAAEAIAALAAAGGGRRSVRLWRRRAAHHARRAEQDADDG